jgi:hypothetical protein
VPSGVDEREACFLAGNPGERSLAVVATFAAGRPNPAVSGAASAAGMTFRAAPIITASTPLMGISIGTCRDCANHQRDRVHHPARPFL